MKITKKIIDGLEVKEKRYYKWDDEVKGFGIAIHPTGHRVYVYKYRTTSGKQNMISLGRYGELTLAQARVMAKDKAYEVRCDNDPAAERQKSRHGDTVADACKKFLEEHVSRKKPKTQEMYRWLVSSVILPAWKSKRIAAITATDASALFHKIGKVHRHKANRLRSTMTKLFDLAERWGMRPRGTNPATFIEKYKEAPRHRDLKPVELKALADALTAVNEEIDNTSTIEVIRLLLFTGCRRGEILNLKWSEVDLDRQMLHLSDSKTGRRTVYLNDAASEILGAITAKVGCPWVFPAAYLHDGKWRPMPEHELRRTWRAVRDKAKLGADGEVPALRIHDLRHTFAAISAGLGLSLPQIGELLGHKQAQTTMRYSNLINGPNIDAAQRVGREISDAMNSAEGVVLNIKDD